LFWWDYGYHAEGYQWTQQLLPRLNEVPVTYRPKFLISAGEMTSFSNLMVANGLHTEALRISRELGDVEYTAWALVRLGYTLLENTELAISLVEEGLSLFRELDHKPGIAQALNIIGVIVRESDYERARRALEECLAVCKQTGEARRICRVFFNLGMLAHHDGDSEGVRYWMGQALRLALEIRFTSGAAGVLAIFSGYVGAVEQPQRVARLLGASQAVMERRGAFLQPHDKTEYDRSLAAVRAQLDEAAFEVAWTEGRKMSLEQAIDYALSAS
jgi:tetratricopeptide (TPR) repeat protein